MTPQIEQRRLVANTSLEKSACLLLITGSLLYYWSVFFYYALDAGQADDFVDVLWFFEIFFEQQHWLDKLAVIALPNHEHVTILNHLIYLSHYVFFEQVNFFHYEIIGHIIVLACCYLLAEWLQKTIGWWYALALAFGIFLNLFYWHASFWAITALSNQAVILFALLAARSVSRDAGAIVMPLLWALLAITAQFNGLLVLPAMIAGATFFCVMNKQKINRIQITVWLAAFLLSTGCYVAYENPLALDHLWRYVNYTEPQLLQEYLVKNPANSAEIGWSNIFQGLSAALATIGASVFSASQVAAAILLGSVIFSCIVWLAWKTAVSADRFWVILVFFALASIGLIAVGRGAFLGAEAGLLYRYRLYSFLLIFLLAGGLCRIKYTAALLWVLVAGGFIVQISSLHVLKDIDIERKNIKVSHYNWLVDGGMGRSQMPFYPHNQDWRLFHAYERGYYNPYQAIDSYHKPLAIVKAESDTCITVLSSSEAQPKITAWSKKAKALAVEIQLGIEPAIQPAGLLFCDGANGYLVTVDKHNINPETGKYWPLLLLKKQLPPSQYSVLLQQVDGIYKPLGDIAFP